MINVNVEKLRKFKFRYSENIGLNELKKHREETTRRWERMGLLDGLVGLSYENSASLFEGELSYTLPSDFK
jgi:hypothetical protein